MAGKVALITESQTCIPQGLIDRFGIRILPFILVMDDVEFRDGVDISPAEFYRLLPCMNGTVVRTASISPGAYLAAFREAARDAESILTITISNKMSVSYQSAVLAAREFDGAPVKVLDSRTAASAQGLAVLETAKLIESGADLDAAYAMASEAARRVELYAYIDTFEYLKRSGHVRAIQALAATAFSIKPVFRFKEGDAQLVAKKRNVQKAKREIVERAEEVYKREGPLNVMLFHANDMANCNELAAMLQARVATQCMLVSEFTPVMGAHTGPGVVGAAFLPANKWKPPAR